MPIKIDLPQQARHVHIFDEDWEFLERHFGRGGKKPIGVSNAIRRIIHAKVLELRGRIEEKINQLESS